MLDEGNGRQSPAKSSRPRARIGLCEDPVRRHSRHRLDMPQPCSPRRGEIRATLSLTGMPEILARMQQRLADLLRACAKDEAPAVADRLRAIAATFETGQPIDLERDEC
jgi:hypothetical protein